MPSPFEVLEPEVWPIDKLRANDWNPNVQDEETLRLTRLSIEEEGFSDPVDVDPTGLILDGEHRWVVAKELGYTEIPVFVKERYDDDAKITTIRKDRTHGEPDLVKMAGIVGTLVEEIGTEEVERRLGFDADEQQSLVELTSWSYDVYDTADQDAIDAAKQETVTWSVAVDQETLNNIDRLLSAQSAAAASGPYGDSEVGRLVSFIEEAMKRA